MGEKGVCGGADEALNLQVVGRNKNI